MNKPGLIPCHQTLLLGIALLLGTTTAMSAEYMFRDLLGNTLAPQKCSTQSEAEARAKEPYNIEKHVKVFCETQGYGWHVSEVKDNGKLVCKPCDGSNAGKSQCHMEDVRVACKRLKPGSVGLFPGEG